MRKRIRYSLTAAVLAGCLAVCTTGCGASGDDIDADTYGYEEEEYPYEDEYYEEDYNEDYSEDGDEAYNTEYDESLDTEETAGDYDYYSEEMGVTFHMPEEYFNVIGSVDFYGQDVSQGEGYFYGEMDYTGVDWEELQQKIQSESVTDEDAADFDKKTVPLFAIMGGTKDKPVSKLVETVNAYADKKFAESDLTLLSEKDGFCFYRCAIDPPEHYENLEGNYRSEYDTLAAFSDELLQNADYTRPVTSFEKMVGNKISFTTTDLDGNTVTSEEIFSRHEITMINVWATWCGWCIGELGELEQINKELAQMDCAIVGLCGDATDAAVISEAKSILNETGVTYLNICPFDGWDETFEVSGWPTSFFVDRNGNMVATPISGAKVNEYKSHIQEALDGKASSYVSETNSYESSNNYYRIIVADQTSAPVEGAMVQFCTDDTCKMGVTDSTGAVTFDDPPGVYEVHVRKLPEGYKENDTTYKTESFYSDMVITVGKK